MSILGIILGLIAVAVLVYFVFIKKADVPGTVGGSPNKPSSKIIE